MMSRHYYLILILIHANWFLVLRNCHIQYDSVSWFLKFNIRKMFTEMKYPKGSYSLQCLKFWLYSWLYIYTHTHIWFNIVQKIKSELQIANDYIEKGHTACRITVVVETDNRRWVGPPSLPLTEDGMSVSSMTIRDHKIEEENWADEIRFSCNETDYIS